MGVTADGCQTGFHHDSMGGCSYNLEDLKQCAPNYLIATPSNNCRTYQCTRVPAGDQYADSNYAGNDSDGTPERPWTRIQDAVDHAPPGGVVYIVGEPVNAAAPRVYDENVVLSHGIALTGACPQLTEIRGSAGSPAVTIKLDGPISLGGPGLPSGGWPGLTYLSVSGGSQGVLAIGNGATGDGGTGVFSVRLDTVQIHDTGGVGVELRDASATVNTTSIRNVSGAGIFVRASQGLSGVSLDLTASRVQTVRPSSSGVHAGCVVATEPQAPGNVRGADPTPVSIAGSLLEDCADAGIYARGANVTVTDTVIRRVHSSERDGSLVSGQGIALEQEPLWGQAGIAASLTLTGSLIEDVADVGVSLRDGAWATVDDTTIRRVVGRGAEPDSGTARTCPESGVGLLALADASDQADAGFRFPSTVTVTNSLIEDARVAGIEIEGASATVTGTIVRATHPDGRRDCPEAFGDGIAVYSSDAVPTDLTVISSRIDASERAGLVSFGHGGHVTVQSAAIECGTFGVVQDERASPIIVPNPGRVVCACNGPGHVCGVEKQRLTPSLVGWQ